MTSTLIRAREAQMRSSIEHMSDQTMRITPLTAVTPIHPGWTSFQRFVLEVLPHTRWGRGQELVDLSFIHSARWSLVTSLPTPDGGRARSAYDYLLFESNFNGGFGPYIEAFADILTPKIRAIWNSSIGFPNLPQDGDLPVRRRLRRPIPGAAFVDYVRAADLGADHYYSAYPEATVKDIIAGLAADEAVDDLRRLAVAPESPAARVAFATRLDDVLSGRDATPRLARQPEAAHGDVCAATCAFTSLTPIVPGQEGTLRRLLAGMGDATTSPFSAAPGVHFARWLVIDSPTHQPGQARDSWPCSYLLTSTTSDGISDPLEVLYRHLGREVVDAVWGRCVGHPAGDGSAAFVGYQRRHRLRTNRLFSGYPHASVEEVLSGLRTRRGLQSLATEYAGGDSEEARRAFRGRFGRPRAGAVRPPGAGGSCPLDGEQEVKK
ncbi:MAG: hypothetical protein ABI746_03275 [Dermatophilaceae bacterium]